RPPRRRHGRSDGLERALQCVARRGDNERRLRPGEVHVPLERLSGLRRRLDGDHRGRRGAFPPREDPVVRLRVERLERQWKGGEQLPGYLIDGGNKIRRARVQRAGSTEFGGTGFGIGGGGYFRGFDSRT